MCEGRRSDRDEPGQPRVVPNQISAAAGRFDDAILPELAKRPDDDLPYGAQLFGRLLLGSTEGKRNSGAYRLLAGLEESGQPGVHILCCQTVDSVYQVPGALS